MHWGLNHLEKLEQEIVANMRLNKQHAGDFSQWWSFIFSWDNLKTRTLTDFVDGNYKFDPLNTCILKLNQ